MNPFPKAVLFVLSGVRGQNVYELTTRRHLVTGPDNSLDVVIQQRFINTKSPYRIRAHHATLQRVASGDYELLIPGDPRRVRGTSPTVRVPIRFETKPTLVGGIHGSSQGPAQYELIGDSHGWTARLEINETLHRRDVPFIIGHELDEIAIIVTINPKDEVTLLAEASASLFKPSSSSTKVTAHDRAAARELCALWADYQHPPPGTSATALAKREQRIGRMFSACGLKESVHIFDKLGALRAEGAPDKLLRRIGVPGTLKSYTLSAPFRVLQAKWPALRKRGSIIDEELISHLMLPIDLGRRFFLQYGINGGHHDTLLHEFVNHHPQIVIVKEAEKVVKGVVYRKYSQYRFRGSGPKPNPHDKRFPKPGDAVTGKYHSDWELAKQGGIPLPKTTFSSLNDFLLAVDEAWFLWLRANFALVRSGITTEFTHFSNEANIQVTGFFYRISKNHYRLDTAYVEASWF